MAELEATMSYPELIEWACHLSLQSGREPPAAAPPAPSSAGKMLQSMKLVAELQKVRR